MYRKISGFLEVEPKRSSLVLVFCDIHTAPSYPIETMKRPSSQLTLDHVTNTPSQIRVENVT